MPGRANQMSAGDAYNMAGSRWSVPLKVLTNKKALDAALQQHTWTMQQKAQDLAGGNMQEHIRGQYRFIEQVLQNQAGSKSNLEYQVLTQAVKMATDQRIDMQSPEGQQKFQQIYQALLNQATGGEQGAMLLAGGEPEQPPNVPEPVWPADPRRMLPGYADYGIPRVNGKEITPEIMRSLKLKSGGDILKAKAMAKKLGYIVND